MGEGVPIEEAIGLSAKGLHDFLKEVVLYLRVVLWIEDRCLQVELALMHVSLELGSLVGIVIVAPRTIPELLLQMDAVKVTQEQNCVYHKKGSFF